jgi:hypothetical protein
VRVAPLICSMEAAAQGLSSMATMQQKDSAARGFCSKWALQLGTACYPTYTGHKDGSTLVRNEKSRIRVAPIFGSTLHKICAAMYVLLIPGDTALEYYHPWDQYYHISKGHVWGGVASSFLPRTWWTFTYAALRKYTPSVYQAIHKSVYQPSG